MTEQMKRALAEAKAYGDWFSITHAFGSPVRARHQTIRALHRLGLLDYVSVTRYNAMGQPCGAYGQYRYKEQS